MTFKELPGPVGDGEPKARDSMLFRSRACRNLMALWIRSGVRRDMMPMVKWRVLGGRMAVSCIPFGLRMVHLKDADSRKALKEAWSWGHVVGVASGMQRKWVSCGGTGGGMVRFCEMRIARIYCFKFEYHLRWC